MIGVVQPLDYAPRKSPDEQGQLSESFGMDKTDDELPFQADKSMRGA